MRVLQSNAACAHRLPKNCCKGAACRCRCLAGVAAGQCFRQGCAQIQSRHGGCVFCHWRGGTHPAAQTACRFCDAGCRRVSCNAPLGRKPSVRVAGNTARVGYQGGLLQNISPQGTTGAPSLPISTRCIRHVWHRVAGKANVVVGVRPVVIEIAIARPGIAAVAPIATRDNTEHVKPPPHSRPRGPEFLI